MYQLGDKESLFADSLELGMRRLQMGIFIIDEVQKVNMVFETNDWFDNRRLSV